MSNVKLKEKPIIHTCCVEGCKSIGKWRNSQKKYYLQKGMCNMHYQRYFRHGEVDFVKCVKGENRVKHWLYVTWQDMKARCLNPNCKSYKDYGGRGVSICPTWLGTKGFTQLLKDMGERPTPKHSIDREDVDGSYCKENCRWATKHEQASNKRNNNKTVGVSFCNTYGKWSAELVFNGKRVLNRKFYTELEAINARKNAELFYGIAV